MAKKAERLLVELGLNQLEAQVYTQLLKLPSATAYKVGKLVGKPTANVYKAIESLRSKGGVMVEMGKSQLCRAVPIQDFMAQMRSGLDIRAKKLEESLKDEHQVHLDEKYYEIDSVDLALQQAKDMIRTAEKIVVLDLFPEVYKLLEEDILAAAKRLELVFLQSYVPLELPGVHVVFPPMAEKVLSHWEGQQMNIVKDAKESMMAIFDGNIEEVWQAAWSQNLYLSNMLHGGFLREHLLVAVLGMLKADSGASEILSYIVNQPFFHNSSIPGNLELLSRYGRKR